MNIKKTNGQSKRVLLQPGHTLPTLAALAGVLVLPALTADAVGFRLPTQDPEAMARGNAFVATADNPSAIYYNPAGITQLPGHEVSVGTYLVSEGITFDGVNGKHGEVDSKFQPVPQFYYTQTLKDHPFSFGVGVYAPYGLAVNWGEDSPFRNAAQFGKMLYATVNPVGAWKINEKLSLAAGPTFNYSKVKFNQGFSTGNPAFPNGTFHFVGDDFAVGFNAGLLWKPIEQLAFGASYHYSTTMDYKGSSSFYPVPGAVSTTATAEFPMDAEVGVSWRPTDKWNLEFDLDWTQWSTTKQLTFSGSIPAFPFHYTDSFMYKFGVTRQFNNGWWGSVGYFYSENSSPNEFFNPIVTDANLSLGSIGFGHKGQHWNWALAYHFGYNAGREVRGSVFSPAVDGTYHVFNNAVSIGATYKF